MDKETLRKGFDLNEQIERIDEEIKLLKDGSMRCDLAHGEGSRWRPIKGISEKDLRNAIIDRLLEKKGELAAKFQKL